MSHTFPSIGLGSFDRTTSLHGVHTLPMYTTIQLVLYPAALSLRGGEDTYYLLPACLFWVNQTAARKYLASRTQIQNVGLGAGRWAKISVTSRVGLWFPERVRVKLKSYGTMAENKNQNAARHTLNG